MKWTADAVLRRIRDVRRADGDLSTTGMRRAGKAGLMTAARKLFGTYAAAVEAAGIDYQSVSRQRRWTRQDVLRGLRQRYRDRRGPGNLHAWAEGGALTAAAVNHFGSYRAGLAAAGIDHGTPVRYRHWTPEGVLDELRRRHREGRPLSPKHLTRKGNKGNGALYATACRLFGSFRAALLAAGLDPPEVYEKPRGWTRETLVRELRRRRRAGEPLTLDWKVDDHRRLYKAAYGLFGSYAHALLAAGIDPRPICRLPRSLRR